MFSLTQGHTGGSSGPKLPIVSGQSQFCKHFLLNTTESESNRRKFSIAGDGSIMEACVIHQDQSLGEGDCHHTKCNVPTQSYNRALTRKFIFVSIFKSADTKLVKNY